ncbi:MAG: DNRLRE domain-containing protein [Desulfobacterales bacterium]
MKKRTYFTTATIILLTIFLGLSATKKPASAAPCIPEGAYIYAATFSIYVDDYTGREVQLHRITAPWVEMEATWGNFGSSYDLLLEGSFVSDGYGWHSVDVTELVQDWANNIYPNYGLLLQQGWAQNATYIRSSEYTAVEYRPKLEICYSDGLEIHCLTIQRPGVEQDGIADAYIWDLEPTYNGGNESTLIAGPVWWSQAQSLIRFEFGTCPKEEALSPGEEAVSPGTESHGYWKNHPEDWPVDEITIGGDVYNRKKAVSFIRKPVKGDKTVNMFRALVAAKLNVIIGNEDSCIADAILAADDWMETNGPVGSGVRGRSPAWREAKSIHQELNDYNNGLLCAPRRD